MIPVSSFLDAVGHARSGALDADCTLHGEPHWRAVAAQGLLVAQICRLGADARAAAAVFGLFHDSRRQTDGWDPHHGARGASAFLESGLADFLPDALCADLVQSMILHDAGQTSSDPRIGIGWDADRSLLTRCGMMPDPAFFSCVGEGPDFERLLAAGRAATHDPPSWQAIAQAALSGHPLIA